MMKLNLMPTNILPLGVATLAIACCLYPNVGQAGVRLNTAATSDASFLYADVGMNYAVTNYEKENISVEHNYNPPNFKWTNVSNGNGGVSYSGDLGYQFTEHFAVELGGGELPTAAYTQAGTKLQMQSWYLYSALEINGDLGYNFNGFGKAGVMYRHLTYHDVANNKTIDVPDAYFGPMLGAGLSYTILSHVRISAEYNYLAETFDTEQNKPAPAANIFLAKLGYQF